MTGTCNIESPKRGRPPLNAMARLRHNTWFRYLAQKCEAEGHPTSDAQIAKLIWGDANFAYAVRRWRLGQTCVSGGTVDLVEQKIPGTKLVYEFGPTGCPLWASITGLDLCHTWEATRRDPLLWHNWAVWRYTDVTGVQCPYGHLGELIISPPPCSSFRDKYSLYDLLYEIIEFSDQSNPLIILCAILGLGHIRNMEVILFREDEIEKNLNKYSLSIEDVITAAQEFGLKVITRKNKLDALHTLYNNALIEEKEVAKASASLKQGFQFGDTLERESMWLMQQIWELNSQYPTEPTSLLPRSLLS